MQEYLCANKKGSFALGAVDRIPRRKYHSLLLMRDPGFGDPLATLVDVCEILHVDDHVASFGLQYSAYQFTMQPNPMWEYEGLGFVLRRSLRLDPRKDVISIFYRIETQGHFRLHMKPLFQYRPWHSLAQKNLHFNGNCHQWGDKFVFEPYSGLPKMHFRCHGTQMEFKSRGTWSSWIYESEKERGYPAKEDLFAPGFLTVEGKGSMEFALEIGVEDGEPIQDMPSQLDFKDRLNTACANYFYSGRNNIHSVVAAFPWSGGFARDTLISLPGLSVGENRSKALDVLTSYADILTGRLIDTSEPKINVEGLDTPLFFVRDVELFWNWLSLESKHHLAQSCVDLLNRLKGGHDIRFRINEEGFIFINPGPWALTWMNVVWDGLPVTSRFGMPIEINALWINALKFAVKEFSQIPTLTYLTPLLDFANQHLEKLQSLFVKKFWMPDRGFFADTHNGYQPSSELRPNQLWCLALDLQGITKEMALSAFKKIDEELKTPVGLRTLSHKDPQYRGRYEGSQYQREMASHQGTVWPWLIGVWSEALVKWVGPQEARRSLDEVLNGLKKHFETEGCLGHLCEVFDGQAPHRPGGAPAKVWSIAEFTRAWNKVVI